MLNRLKDNVMIDIRRANVKDAKSISYLGAKTFDQSYGQFFDKRNTITEYLNIAFSLDKIEKSLANPDNLYWLVEDVESLKPIGYGKLKLNSPSEFIKDQNVCKLQRIYLLQGYESQGIGSKLHQQMIEAAIDLSYTYLWLSNLKKKEQAVSFYKNKRYQVAGEHNFTIGNETFQFWAMKIKL